MIFALLGVMPPNDIINPVLRVMRGNLQRFFNGYQAMSMWRDPDSSQPTIWRRHAHINPNLARVTESTLSQPRQAKMLEIQESLWIGSQTRGPHPVP
jgi:hypothetical protein